MSMLQDIQEVFYSQEDLAQIANRLGHQISHDYKDRNLLIVSVLKGSVIFMADLMRSITIPCKIDFITASSYHAGTESSGKDVTAFFYSLLNARVNTGMSTVISTNLSHKEMLAVYDERIASRLFGEFFPYLFTGRDIRMQKLQEG